MQILSDHALQNGLLQKPWTTVTSKMNFNFSSRALSGVAGSGGSDGGKNDDSDSDSEDEDADTKHEDSPKDPGAVLVSVDADEPGEVTLGSSSRPQSFVPSVNRVPVLAPPLIFLTLP